MYMVRLLINEPEQSRPVRSWDKMAANALKNTFIAGWRKLEKSKLKAVLIVFFNVKGVFI